eukprot:gene55802-74515_t
MSGRRRALVDRTPVRYDVDMAAGSTSLVSPVSSGSGRPLRVVDADARARLA